MKLAVLSILLFSIQNFCYSQLIKQVTASAKGAINNRINIQTNKMVNAGIDSLGKKLKNKAKSKQIGNTALPVNPNNTNPVQTDVNTIPSSPQNNKISNNGDEEGYIEMKLSSPKIFTGGTLAITGESGFHEKLTTIDLIITGPGVNNTYVVALDKNGKFATLWYAKGEPGKYKATAISSDKKTSKTVEFTIEALDELDETANDNIEVIANVVEAIKKQVNIAKNDLSTKHNAEIDKKMAELNNKAEQLKAIFRKINQAGKLISSAAKKGEVLPEKLAGNLSQLKDALEEHKESTQKILANVNRQTYAYTICETLEMVNEACAAFSTATNFAGKFKTIAKNLALDKLTPVAATAVNEYSFNKKMPDEAVVPGVKLLTSAAADTEGLITGTGPMGLAGDMTQLVANVLLKEYCGSFEGTVQHEFKVAHRNKAGAIWWSYSYTTQAVLTLRYPKNKGNGKTVQMKGHIEGNATKFIFFQNMAVEDEYDRISKGRAPLIQLRVIAPIALPFASSEKDKAGFGMMARAVATPSYFNLPVDAAYDRDAGTIRLFLTEGGIDFTPLVKNRVLFLMPLVIPIFKIQDFTIEKAKATMNSVIKRYGEYKVIDDKKGGLSFKGNGTHHSGSKTSDLELNVNLSIEAKQ